MVKSIYLVSSIWIESGSFKNMLPVCWFVQNAVKFDCYIHLLLFNKSCSHRSWFYSSFAKFNILVGWFFNCHHNLWISFYSSRIQFSVFFYLLCICVLRIVWETNGKIASYLRAWWIFSCIQTTESTSSRGS